MTCVIQPLVPPHQTGIPGARETLAFAPADPWETVCACALRPGSGPPTLHTHPVCETVCVTEGLVGILIVLGGKAYQERVRAGKTYTIPAHVPHVVMNIGITTAHFLTVQPVSSLMCDTQ